MCIPMGHTPRQLGDIGNKYLVFFAPVNDDLILFHLQVTSHFISQNDRPDLSYLIGLGFTVVPLQVYLLLDAFFSEIVMTSTRPLCEPKSQQKLPQIIKRYIRIRSTPQDLKKQLFVFTGHFWGSGLYF
jgi:hypothetical protein